MNHDLLLKRYNLCVKQKAQLLEQVVTLKHEIAQLKSQLNKED